MDVLLVARDEGEEVSDTTEIKAGREELVVTEFLYPPGKSGPELHIHREHADCFWVLGGELELELGADGECRRAAPGAFVLVPPEVVHTFRNPGPAEARFLNIHAPGKGFDDHLRAMDAGEETDFDSFDPPEDGGRPASDAPVVEAGEGEDELILAEIGPVEAREKDRVIVPGEYEVRLFGDRRPDLYGALVEETSPVHVP